MSRRARVRALVLLVAAGAPFIGAACVSTSSNNAPASFDASQPSLDGSGPRSDASPGPDGASQPLASCKAILGATPGAPSGRYPIDPDGPGGRDPVTSYCDMTFDGGGWTLLQATTGGASDVPFPAVVDSDASVLVAEPQPGVYGSLGVPLVVALAATATQVHIRSPFAPDGGDNGAWITSVVPAGGGASVPIQNLRKGMMLNASLTDGTQAQSDYVGPNAVAELLAFPLDSRCTDFAARGYPSIYWACNNHGGLHFLMAGDGISKWRFDAGTNEALEVYVR